ncbi:lysine-specific histone demethylase 1 like protein 1 [Quercus suber]|uniref:Lysine-specific histone demethylase 1 like protein 1 n=1 Tax=Quercus suber TaxID=58331 RepID=A0AAW0KPY7_QUESU
MLYPQSAVLSKQLYCGRNHILTRWRSNVSVWLTRDHSLESIRSEHKGLSTRLTISFSTTATSISGSLRPSKKPS